MANHFEANNSGAASKLLPFVSAAVSLTQASAQAAQGGYRSDDVQVRYNHAEYNESGNRMQATVDQVAARFPLGDKFEGSIVGVRDLTSGASPVANLITPEGDPRQIVEAGASIEDTRDVIDLGMGYYGENTYLSVNVGNSLEDDYESDFASVHVSRDLNKKNTTVSTGLAYADDRVWNSYDPRVPLLVPTEFNNRSKRDLQFGFSQLLDKNSLLQFNVTYSQSRGHLSDPYKKVMIEDEALLNYRAGFNIPALLDTVIDLGLFDIVKNSGAFEVIQTQFELVGFDETQLDQFIRPDNTLDVNKLIFDALGLRKDSRPEQRDQLITLVRMSRFFPAWDSALHTDYRYATDDWGIDSHTVELKWKMVPLDGWEISPSIRYYTQSNADFYGVFFTTRPEDNLFSSDYRLAGFGATSYKLEFIREFSKTFTLQANFEYYDRKYSQALGGADGSEVDDYTSSTISVSLRSAF